MTSYSYDNSLEELIDAHSVGLTIELNGSAVNGGYGETWNNEMFNGDENNMSEGLSLALGNHARYFRNKKGE